MATKSRANVDQMQGLGVENVVGDSKLVGAVVMGVD